MIFKKWKPAVFQGSVFKHGYFEGWYFKCVCADETAACAIIPGVSLSHNSRYAFIQIFLRDQPTAFNFKYPLDKFRFSHDPFHITIGESSFSLAGVNLDITEGDQRIIGTIEFSGMTPWPVRLFSPGAMGWFGLIPAMECYHGVLSFDHALTGYLRHNGTTMELSGGRGYIEKDWGTSMPEAWIWMQSNHFNNPGISLFGSIAKIPWLGSSFTGFIFGFYLQGVLYRFATYTGARLRRIELLTDLVRLTVCDRRYCLELEVERREGVTLAAPKLGAMSAKTNESLDSTVHMTLRALKTGMIVFQGSGRNAGFECGGDVTSLVDRLRIEK